ncbi:hypothetical protein [Tumebacillus flagellatus]|uniref:Uncharacterized protein n=1 Tax=Tumebacillus flagellatus TaxID=1157490 RepID=A0A074LVL8_9BACL|nr:hypothetical protein [Tumebacillus flagellatus]KEO84078.1 hypothetical protein EL26_06335 [Tumebacillus flagellatus]
MSDIVDDFEVEMMPDLDLLLLSWTQMVAIEMIAPDEESQAAKTDLAAKLQTDFGVTDLLLKERTYTHYVVSFREKNREREMEFENEEVESIYNL